MNLTFLWVIHPQFYKKVGFLGLGKEEFLPIHRLREVFNTVKNKSPGFIRAFLLIHRKRPWLLRLSISIEWLKVENFMKDFKAHAPRIEVGELLSKTRGAA